MAVHALTPIPMHPEPVAHDSQAMRWVIPAGLIACGVPVEMPSPLAELFDSKLLVKALVEESAIWLWVGPEQSWSTLGVRVRAALSEALCSLDQWRIESDDERVLTFVATEVLDGPVGDVIRSHGGRVELTCVAGNTVTVRMSGACSSCPAIGFTLRNRIEQEIRRRYSPLEKVLAA